MRYNELTFQGRNAVLEAFRSGKTIDKLFILTAVRMDNKEYCQRSKENRCNYQLC